MKPVIAFATLAALVLAGPALSQSRPDPMRMAAAQHGTVSPTDPMVALRAPTGQPADGPAASEEFGGMPDAPGAEDTYYQCTACHSTEIIKQQRITDARWDDLWVWMIDKQGMIDADPETRELILTYLKTYFSSEPGRNAPAAVAQ
ncbi:cytochrome C-552 [Paracoccus sp. (in: a-proteobacteria)]|uniref:cytochrome C-552 n=1 Tax=Paracoccus sp. TaxID=267 RepID=UPI003A881EE6